MKKNQKAKMHSFKRRLVRIIYLLEFAIIAVCIGLVSYLILCERQVIASSFYNQKMEEEISKNNATEIQQEVIIKEEKQFEEPKVESEAEIGIELDVAPKEEDALDTKVIPIEIIGEVDKENIKIAEEELKLVPVELVEAFIKDENHWKLYMTDEDIRNKYYAGKGSRCMGITIYDYYRIEIENRKKAAKAAPIHEMGHFLDYKIKKIRNMDQYPSLTPEFLQIYVKEVNQFVANIENEGCVSNSREFFAETFYYYVKEPSKCTPEAMEYIQSQLNILRDTVLQ